MALICDHCGRDFTWSGGGAKLKTGLFSSLTLCGACATQVRAAMAAEKMAGQGSASESTSPSQDPKKAATGCLTLIAILLVMAGIGRLMKKDEPANPNAPPAQNAAAPALPLTVSMMDPAPVHIRAGETRAIRINVSRSNNYKEPATLQIVSYNVLIDYPKQLITMQGDEQTKELAIGFKVPWEARPGEGSIEVWNIEVREPRERNITKATWKLPLVVNR